MADKAAPSSKDCAPPWPWSGFVSYATMMILEEGSSRGRVG